MSVLVQQILEAIKKKPETSSSFESEPSAVPQSFVVSTEKRFKFGTSKWSLWITPLGTFIYGSSSCKKVISRSWGEQETVLEDIIANSSRVKIHPWRWLLAQAVEVSWTQGFGLSDFRLTTRNVVPETAPCFELAKRGDIKGLNDLLFMNEASIFDVDPDGYSLLHVS